MKNYTAILLDIFLIKHIISSLCFISDHISDRNKNELVLCLKSNSNKVSFNDEAIFYLSEKSKETSTDYKIES